MFISGEKVNSSGHFRRECSLRSQNIRVHLPTGRDRGKEKNRWRSTTSVNILADFNPAEKLSKSGGLAPYAASRTNDQWVVQPPLP